MRTINIVELTSSGLPVLLASPDSNERDAPVLLFLHGKGEAGSSPNELPMVCLHQAPPFQAVLGHIPDAFVLAPQAPPVPSKDDWNWRDHVNGIAQFILDRFVGRRVVATGFSRGGLGVLQILATHPDLLQAWAIVDPQPARDQDEENAILNSPAIGRGWLRYGVYRDRNDAWKHFASALEMKLPAPNRDVTQLDHSKMALRAYQGAALSVAGKQNLYDFLAVRSEAAA